MTSSRLTPERLRQHILYDPESGIFYWRSRGGVATATRGKKGSYLWVMWENRQWAAHRLAFLYMTGAWPNRWVDHVDGDPSNNAWFNLRAATPSQNAANAKLRTDNTSGLKGVSLTRSGTWYACIWVEGKKRCLGTYPTKEAAHAAYVKAASEAFGPFMRIA